MNGEKSYIHLTYSKLNFAKTHGLISLRYTGFKRCSHNDDWRYKIVENTVEATIGGGNDVWCYEMFDLHT